MKKKVIFLILDGISDPDAEKTALEQAFKPNLDLIAKNSLSGLIENRLGHYPDSGISNFVLLGYPEADYPGRGYLDALGAGLEPIPGSVYVRANFVTVEEILDDSLKTGTFRPKLKVIDRRAGRDSSGLFEMSKDIKEFFLDGVRIDFHKSLGYRGVIVLNSVNISPAVSDSDPGYVTDEEAFVKHIIPLERDPEAARTAAALNKFEEETHKIMKEHPSNKYRKKPANFLLLRGASTYKYIKSFKYTFGLDAACVAASPVIKGIAKAMEMEAPNISGGTGDTKTNLREKTMKAIDLLNRYDFVILHILGFDACAHDKDNNKKRLFIEKVDREVFRRLLEYCNFEKTVLVVGSDHPTSTKTGGHKAGFMPFLIFTKDVETSGVENFNEKECKIGPVIPIEEFMDIIIKHTQ